MISSGSTAAIPRGTVAFPHSMRDLDLSVRQSVSAIHSALFTDVS